MVSIWISLCAGHATFVKHWPRTSGGISLLSVLVGIFVFFCTIITQFVTKFPSKQSF